MIYFLCYGKQQIIAYGNPNLREYSILAHSVERLRIKEFYGTSENAVKIQIYAAIITYCLVVIVKKCMRLKLQTYDILRILSTTLLTEIPLCDLLIDRKRKNLQKENNSSSASILMGNYQIVTF